VLNFRFITHLETASVITRLLKSKPSTWKAAKTWTDPKTYRTRFLILRHHANPSEENWLQNLPVEDTQDLKEWDSMQRLMKKARDAIYADPAFRPFIDPTAPPGRAVLSALEPGDALTWHTDTGPYHERHLRFHIPIITNPLCQLQVKNEVLHMEVGSLWWMNHGLVHTAVNFGSHRRVHLVFELPRQMPSEGDSDA
jgi:hypothetical protein